MREAPAGIAELVPVGRQPSRTRPHTSSRQPPSLRHARAAEPLQLEALAVGAPQARNSPVVIPLRMGRATARECARNRHAPRAPRQRPNERDPDAWIGGGPRLDQRRRRPERVRLEPEAHTADHARARRLRFVRRAGQQAHPTGGSAVATRSVGRQAVDIARAPVAARNTRIDGSSGENSPQTGCSLSKQCVPRETAGL